MAVARCILPGRMYLLTRRCVGRKYLLRPDTRLNRAFRYCLAYWAQRHGILVHAIVVQSNHWHLVVSDPRGLLPDFVRDFNRTLAECVNTLRGKKGKRRRGPVFESHRSYGCQWIETEEALVDACAYVLANPVRAGLVRRSDQWPGVVSRPDDMCHGPTWVPRPDLFAKGDRWPDQVPLQIRPPASFEQGAEQFAASVAKRLGGIEHEMRAQLESQGRSVLGEKRILRTDPFDAPTTEDKPSDFNPQFLAATAEGIRRAKRQLREWHHAYRQAFTAFKAGDHATIFPAGTWWMVRHACARCAPS